MAVIHSSSLPIVVVLTGGIASGKSTVSQIFESLGVPIIDTDVIAREVVQPGQPALARLVNYFGEDYLKEDGSLDRSKLRQLIFTNREARRQLENIVHPAIRQIAKQQVKEVEHPYCILVIPLFAESKGYDWVNRVLVVDVDEETQIKRVMRRDNIEYSQAKAILKSQASRKERLAIADDVIDNSNSPQSIVPQVERLHQKYLNLA